MESGPDPRSRRRAPGGGRAQTVRGARPLTTLSALAPAKINLFLHVGPPAADGYHPLASLVAFADIGDLVTVTPATELSLRVTGPFAGGLEAPGDNLILKALCALGEAVGAGDPPLAVTLDKRLPIAAGLGGGSSDAGAALRLADCALDLGLGRTRLAEIARVVGADGPMCLTARAAWAEGAGERLTLEPALPHIPAVLVNPGHPSPTGAVYRTYDAAVTGRADLPAPPADWRAPAVVSWLAAQRNDLEAAAISLEPAIGRSMTALAGAPGVRLVRMSGSGATAFGLFDTMKTAKVAAAGLRAAYPDWWVTATLLGDQPGQ